MKTIKQVIMVVILLLVCQLTYSQVVNKTKHKTYVTSQYKYTEVNDVSKIIPGVSKCTYIEDESETVSAYLDPYGLSNDMYYTCSPNNVWVEDKEKEKALKDKAAKAEKDRIDLVWALKTRILSAEEMDKVKALGEYGLLIGSLRYIYSDGRDNVLKEQFNALMLQQFTMRLIAEKIKDKSCLQSKD